MAGQLSAVGWKMKEGAFGAYINATYRQHPLWWLTPPPCPLGSVSLDSQSPIGSLQHGYHRLTGFSGRSCSPTNPVRWCDSSSLATPIQGALWVLGGGVNLSLWQQRRETQTTGLRPEKTSRPPCRALEMHPFCRLSAASLHGKASHEIFSRLPAPYKFRSLATPEGEILAALCLDVLMSSEAEWRANFPLRERYRRRRG